MGKFINISATIDTKLNLVQSQGQSCLSLLKVHCLDFKMLENHTHQYHVNLIFQFSKLNLAYLVLVCFLGRSSWGQSSLFTFLQKKTLCSSDLLMLHDPVGILNKVYDKCNDYQFKNYILFYLLLLHSQWPSSNIKMFMTQLFVLLSTKSVFQYQFCDDDNIQMDPYRALWSIDSLAW